MARWALTLSGFQWNTGLTLRSCLVTRKDSSTCQRLPYCARMSWWLRFFAFVTTPWRPSHRRSSLILSSLRAMVAPYDTARYFLAPPFPRYSLGFFFFSNFFLVRSIALSRSRASLAARDCFQLTRRARVP